ncbi:MAG: hypothetical protein HKO79_02515, partial [Desulfobacterales bacterium]|nr:hypothetical protein [Deltaproteobacteria bacterium]NNL41340.1 hypothetical protein [Desulfobacterales bacterium]
MKKIFLTFLLFAIYPIAAGSDTIFLKDGKKITTKKAWEENGLIKFYLEGSESIIITYSKNIIDRIESQSNKAEEPPPKIPNPLKPPVVSAKNFREPTEEKEIIRDEKPQNLPQASMVKKPDPAPSALTLHAMGIKKSDGVLFYNPRRKNKYWTSNTSRHDTLEAAMASLAKQYGRSPEWVIANM